MDNVDFIESVFKNKSNKHGFNVFDKKYLDKLSFKEIYKQIDKSLHFRGQDFDNMYMTSFIQYLIDYGWQVKASLIKNGWLEVDTVEDLESYDQMSKETLDSYCRL